MENTRNYFKKKTFAGSIENNTDLIEVSAEDFLDNVGHITKLLNTIFQMKETIERFDKSPSKFFKVRNETGYEDGLINDIVGNIVEEYTVVIRDAIRKEFIGKLADLEKKLGDDAGVKLIYNTKPNYVPVYAEDVHASDAYDFT